MEMMMTKPIYDVLRDTEIPTLQDTDSCIIDELRVWVTGQVNNQFTTMARGADPARVEGTTPSLHGMVLRYVEYYALPDSSMNPQVHSDRVLCTTLFGYGVGINHNRSCTSCDLLNKPVASVYPGMGSYTPSCATRARIFFLNEQLGIQIIDVAREQIIHPEAIPLAPEDLYERYYHFQMQGRKLLIHVEPTQSENHDLMEKFESLYVWCLCVGAGYAGRVDRLRRPAS